MSSSVFPILCACLFIITAISHSARSARPIGHALSWLPVFQAQAKRQTLPVTLLAINGSNYKEASLSCSKVAGAPDGVVRCRRGGGSAPAPTPAAAPSGETGVSSTVASATTAGHGTSDSGSHGGHVIHAPEILYIFLTLIIGAIAKYALKLVRHYFVMPYTVFVLILGCIYGALASKTVAIQTFVRIASADPNVILLTFLPGLIYEAAFSMQTHLFKKLFFHIILIGVIGMAINVVAIAYISEQVFGPSTTEWNIHVGLLFSAIVSATDPIAAVAMLKEAGSDKTLTTVLEGSSLLSDTSAVVLFNLFMQNARIHSNSSAMTAADLSVGKEVTSFFLNVFGGPAWGLGVGFLLTQLLSRMSSVWEAELILILSVPYLVFWAADAGFGISGALANLVLGLWMSSHRTTISPDVEELVDRIWEIICLISNTLIFSLVGVIIVETAMHNVSSEDWILLVIINIFLLLVRALSFIVLKPLLIRIGIGPKVFTWSHIFVLSWSGFKGAVTLALGIMGSKDEIFAGEKEERVRARLLFHSAGVVAFTLLFNASTMRFFLKRLGILDLPLSKMITMHMAMKQIMLTRNQKLDALKTDRYLADADWQRVDDLTKVEGSRYGVEDESQTSLWTIHYVTREVSCPSCQAEVQLEPLATELAEMEGIARLRLVNAKKTSYWRQYEEGTLSQSGIKYLDDLSDTVLNSDHGVIDADDVKNALHSETWTLLKKKIGEFQHWVENHTSVLRFIPPGSQWRQKAFKIAVSQGFLYATYVVIFANMVETIVDWCLLSDWNDVNGTVTHRYFLYSNMGYSAFYTFEAAVKIIGLGWFVYWGKTWWNWNRFDLFLLLLTYVDLVLDCLAEFGDASMASMHEGVVSTSIIKIFRFFRLVRFGRALRLLKPLVPRVLHFLDGRVNAHLFVAYDIAKAFIVAQEECAMMVSSVVGYKPLAAKFKTQADGDCRVVLKEIGLLNEKRPDVAAAVKTRQAIRSILNHLHKSVEHMSSQGILDEDEVDHLQATIEDRLKRLHHFPHSIAIVRSFERLWNVPWINGNQEVFEVMKLLFEERQYESASQFMTANHEADGIYVLISGVVSLSYPRVYTDNPELGEIYNSDNLRTVAEDHSNDNVTQNDTEGPRLDYVLAGGLLNEQSLALDFPRRSHAVSDTVIGLLYLNAESFFRAMAVLPSLEARFWRRVASSVALNILIKLGALTDSTFETDKLRLSRAAVRLVRPGVKIVGLDEFDEVFLISGTLIDLTTSHHEAIIGPRKVPATYREVEVRQGRHVVTTKTGQVIYPEYAVLFLVPPGNKDLSMINIHDSQHNLTERSAYEPETVKKFLKAQIANRTGSMPSDTQLPVFLQEDRAPVVTPLPMTADHGMGGSTREKRGSDVGAMLQHARIRRNSSVLQNVLAYHRAGEAAAPATPSEGNLPVQGENTRRSSSVKSPKETLSKIGNWVSQKK